ncbi:DUF1841 family protein [Viridibacterium curvum]|uniref:DUF1841 family protein n=1 Tax=Viridibacterium curvum TaxID=1101404 RepID=A0ABP9QDI8_9RHOO
MFNPTRDQARSFFIECWRKRKGNEPMEAMEQLVADIIASHPEYHSLFENPDAADKDFAPEDGQINPFLHISLHLAVEEQLGIDQPPGLREAYQACLNRCGNAHEARHDVLESLAETLWEAQRNGTPMDAMAYVERVKRRGGA